MNSIVLTRTGPTPPASGAALRNWQNIRALASFGPVDVVTVGTDEAVVPVDGVREWVTFSLAGRSRWDRFRTACAPVRPGAYPGVDLYHSSRVQSWLDVQAARHRYDLALIEGISLAGYLTDLKRTVGRVVFDAHNIESTLHRALVEDLSAQVLPMAQRIRYRVLNRRMTAAEGRAVAGADLVWVCSAVDAREVDRLYGRRGGVTVVPNGVDVDAYRRAGALQAGADWSRTPVTMVYPGLFTYSPNEDAALRLVRDVLPAVRARGGDARVVLVGREPTPAILEAAARAPGVIVTGAVESIVPHLEQPCVVTLPIVRGSGTRLKILEAFAVGRPVVSTAKGAEGIDAFDGEHLLIREDADAIAEAVLGLWRQPLLRARLCDKALERVRDRYSWSSAGHRIAQSLGVAPPGGAAPPVEGSASDGRRVAPGLHAGAV